MAATTIDSLMRAKAKAQAETVVLSDGFSRTVDVLVEPEAIVVSAVCLDGNKRFRSWERLTPSDLIEGEDRLLDAVSRVSEHALLLSGKPFRPIGGK